MAWCKSGTRTQDLGLPSKLKSGTRDPLQNLKVGPQDPFQSLKVGPLSPFFNKFIFFRIFHRFFYLFIFVSFLNKIQKISTVSNKSIVNTKDKQVYGTTKKVGRKK